MPQINPFWQGSVERRPAAQFRASGLVAPLGRAESQGAGRDSSATAVLINMMCHHDVSASLPCWTRILQMVRHPSPSPGCTRCRLQPFLMLLRMGCRPSPSPRGDRSPFVYAESISESLCKSNPPLQRPGDGDVQAGHVVLSDMVTPESHA